MSAQDHPVSPAVRGETVDPPRGFVVHFDELIHAPTRLSLVSLLAAAEWVEFKYLRDAAGLSDSALSKQLSTLEEAGYVHVRKGFVGKRPRTWARLSPAGRAAFVAHVAALQEIVRRAGGSLIATDGDDAASAEEPDQRRASTR